MRYAFAQNSNAGQDSWKVVINDNTTNRISILPGMFVIDGQQIIIDEEVTVSGLTTPGGARTDYVWVHIDDQEWDYHSDSDMFVDPVIGQTANRSKLVPTFIVVEGSAVPPAVTGGYLYVVASLSRIANANVTAGMITDLRYISAQNYVEQGLDYQKTAALTFTMSAGSAVVGGTRYYYTATPYVLNPNVTTYYYINNAGVVTVAATIPDMFEALFVPLFKFITNGTGITTFIDLRLFAGGSPWVDREVYNARGSFDSLSEAHGLRGTATFNSTTGVVINLAPFFNRAPAGFSYSIEINRLDDDPTVGDIRVTRNAITANFTVYCTGTNDYSTFEWVLRHTHT
ncbi:MAG: hypothetical protein WC783_02660 [Candidatus Paceibacterota bacterium]